MTTNTNAALAVKIAELERTYRNVEYTEGKFVAAELRHALTTAAVPPAGWVMVPVEPTDAMIQAGEDAENNDGKTYIRAAWRYMLAAAPKAEPVPADPLDWPLPCDLTAGSVTIKKGCPLRTVQTRLQVQSDANTLLLRAQAAPADLERLRERIAMMGLDVDRAMRGEVNTESPLGAQRLQAIASLAAPAAVAGPSELQAEAAKLAPILHSMVEGGATDGETDIYADDYDPPDGDVFVFRAAKLLAALAVAPTTQAPHSQFANGEQAGPTAMQALEALDELESSARGDEPFNHFAAPLIRQHIESTIAAPVAQGDALTQAARDVLAERQRQISAEGWTPEHDDEHGDGEMAEAAACYARLADSGSYLERRDAPPVSWPWAKKWWKPGPARRMLVKAGALILAEMERLDRAAARSQAKEGA